MILPPHDAKLFFTLHGSLMQFVKDRLKIVTAGPADCRYVTLPPGERAKVVKAFLGRLDLIDSFVTEDPAGLAPSGAEIVSGWRHLVGGNFLVLRQLKKHAIFLTTRERALAYGVVGISDPVEIVVGSYLPAMVETVLLPFKGKIIYHGLAARFNVLFGGGARRNFEDSYREARNRHGVVTSLPVETSSGPDKSLSPTVGRAETTV